MGLVRTRVVLVLAAAATAAMLSAACSGDGQGALTGAAKAGPGSAMPGGTTLAVTEKEYAISTPAFTIAPGTYTVEVANRGKMSHNLNIQGPGVSNWRSPTVSPGTTINLSVGLQRGTYELWCSIDHHRALGMETRIHVN